MAVEDGKTMQMTQDQIAKLLASRTESFERMMDDAANKGYEIVRLREANGFVARLAVKPAKDFGRGLFIICPGGGFMFKSWNEALPVAEFFYQKGIGTAILDYHVNPDEGMKLNAPIIRTAGEDGLEAIRYLRRDVRDCLATLRR